MRDLIKAKSKLELPEGMLSSVIDAMADLHPQLPIFFLVSASYLLELDCYGHKYR